MMEIVEIPRDVYSFMEFNYIENSDIKDEKFYKFEPKMMNQYDNIPQYTSYRIDNSTYGPFDFPDNLVKVSLSLFITQSIIIIYRSS